MPTKDKDQYSFYSLLLSMSKGASSCFALVHTLAFLEERFFDSFERTEEMENDVYDYYAELLADKTGNARDRATALVEEGQVSIKNFKETNLKKEEFWTHNPFDNRSWGWGHHSWMGIWPLAQAAVDENDPSFIKELESLVTRWMEEGFSKPESQEMLWHDHATALRLDKILALYVYLYDQFSAPFQNLLKKAIVVHVALLSREEFYTKHTNHGYDQALAMYQASHPSIIKGLEDFNELAYARLLDEISFGFTGEGVHKENSPAYHRGMVNNILRARNILTVLPYGGDEQCMKFINDLLNKALFFLACIAQPDGYVPILGDSISMPLARSLPQLKDLPYYKYYLYVAHRGRQGKRPKNFNVFKESGYVTVRRPVPENYANPGQDLHIVFKCGLLSRYHRHDDDLNVLLYAYGEQWLIDSGMYNHQRNDPVRNYMRSMMAHNIPILKTARPIREPALVDKDWGIREGYIDDTGLYFEGETGMFPSIRVSRRIHVNKCNHIAISDRIIPKGALEQTPCWLFHIPLDKKIERTKTGLAIKGRKMTLTLDVISETDPRFGIFKGFKARQPSVVSKRINEIKDSWVLRYIPKDQTRLHAEFRLSFAKKV